MDLRRQRRPAYSTALLFRSTPIYAFARSTPIVSVRTHIGRMNTSMFMKLFAWAVGPGVSTPLQVFGYEVPVHQLVAEGLEERLSRVSVVNIVGVFPNICGE